MEIVECSVLSAVQWLKGRWFKPQCQHTKRGISTKDVLIKSVLVSALSAFFCSIGIGVGKVKMWLILRYFFGLFIMRFKTNTRYSLLYNLTDT